jgi:hypothetical protein
MTRLQRARRFAAVGAVTVAAGGSLAGTARAQIIPVPDFCGMGDPHVTLTLPNSPPRSVTAGSLGNYYYYLPLHYCRKFIVDVNAPAGRSLTLDGDYAGPPNGGSGPGVPLGPNQCEKYVQSETIYRKAAPATTFTRIATRTFRGAWVKTLPQGGFCLLILQSGGPDETPLAVDTFGALGTTTFRMAVSAKIDDWTAVRVTAAY